jgi:hypothetical protein
MHAGRTQGSRAVSNLKLELGRESDGGIILRAASFRLLLHALTESTSRWLKVVLSVIQVLISLSPCRLSCILDESCHVRQAS